MHASTNPRHNQLLAALPQERWQRWLPHLEHANMPLAQVLCEPGGTLSHVYFPTTAIVSLLYVMQNGESAEIAVVGNEGIVGVSLYTGPCGGRSIERSKCSDAKPQPERGTHDSQLRLNSLIEVCISLPPPSTRTAVIKAFVAREFNEGVGIEWCDFAPNIIRELLRYALRSAP